MPLSDEELGAAIDARILAKRLSSRARARWSGRMDPKDLPWHEAAELAQAADSAARCIGWLVDEVNRLREYEAFYKELNASTDPVTISRSDTIPSPSQA